MSSTEQRIKQESFIETGDQLRQFPIQTRQFVLPENHTAEQFHNFIELRRRSRLKSNLFDELGVLGETDTVPMAPTRQVDLPPGRPDLYVEPTNEFPLGYVKRRTAYKYVLDNQPPSLLRQTEDFTVNQLPEADPELRLVLLETILATSPMLSHQRIQQLTQILEIGNSSSPKNIEDCTNAELKARVDLVAEALATEGEVLQGTLINRKFQRLDAAMELFRTATGQTLERARGDIGYRFNLRTPAAQRSNKRGEVHTIKPTGLRETRGIATQVMEWAAASEESYYPRRFESLPTLRYYLNKFDKELPIPSPDQFLQLRSPIVIIHQGYLTRNENKYTIDREVVDEDTVIQGPQDAYDHAKSLVEVAHLAVTLYETMVLKVGAPAFEKQRSIPNKLRAILQERSIAAWPERGRLVGRVIGVRRVLNTQLATQLRLPLLQYIASDLHPKYLDIGAWSVSMPRGIISLRELVQSSMIDPIEGIINIEAGLSREEIEYYQLLNELCKKIIRYFDQLSEVIQRAVGEISGETVSREIQDVVNQLFPGGTADKNKIIELCNRLGVTEWSSSLVADVASAILITRSQGNPALLDSLTQLEFYRARLHPIFVGTTGVVRQSRYAVMLQQNASTIQLDEIKSGAVEVPKPEFDKERTMQMVNGPSEVTLSNAVTPVFISVGQSGENRFLDPVFSVQREITATEHTVKWVPAAFSEIAVALEALGITPEGVNEIRDDDPRLLNIVRTILRFSPRRFAPISGKDYATVVNAQVSAVINTFNTEHRFNRDQDTTETPEDIDESHEFGGNVVVQYMIQLILKAFRVSQPYYVSDYILTDEDYDFGVSQFLAQRSVTESS